MKHILFIDTRNATRSQIVEAWFNHLANGYAEARSCGTIPADRVGGRAIQVMKKVNINIPLNRPRPITQQLMNWAEVIVLLGSGIFSPCVRAHSYLEDRRPNRKIERA